MLNVKQVQLETSKLIGDRIAPNTIRLIMKDRLRLSYRKIKRVQIPGNSERCLVLRHLYARKMLKLLQDEFEIVNIDESWLPVSDFNAYSWKPVGERNSHGDEILKQKINIIVATSTDGSVFLA